MTKAIIILLLAICTLKVTCGSRCNSNCALFLRLFVCRIEEKDYVWSVVEGVCRIFQNGCYFSAENYQRSCRCECAMISTSPENCMQSCPDFCPEIYAPVCAIFPNTNTTIANDYRREEFPNRCFLNSYACRNAIAYIGEPENGQCQSTTQ